MAIYDRIDLVAIGTWANGFRPQGLVLSFGTNLVGGEVFSELRDVTLPYGTVIDMVHKLQEDLSAAYVCSAPISSPLPYNTEDDLFAGAYRTATGIGFNTNTVFTSITFPPGVNSISKLVDINNGDIIAVGTGENNTYNGEYKFAADSATQLLPFNTILTSAYLPEDLVLNVTLSALQTGKYGVINTGMVQFPWGVRLTGVRIPYGTNFPRSVTLDGWTIPAGKLAIDPSETFQMQTTQLVNSLGQAIFSVHGIDTEELITFARPAVGVNIARLIMYRDGVGVPAPPFACYKIEFKTLVTAAEIKNFNLLHPSDVNAIIIDDGTMSGVKYIIP